MELLVAGHLLLGLLGMSALTVGVLARRELDLMTLVLLVFAIFYGFAPAALHVASAVGVEHRWQYEVTSSELPFDAVLGLASLGFLSLLGGWWLARRLRLPRIMRKRAFGNRQSEKPIFLEPLRVCLLGWTLLVGSVALMYLHTRPYGGFVDALGFAPAIRAGVVEIENAWSFLRPLGGLSLFSCFLFLGLLRCRRASDRASARLGLVLSFIVAIYVLLSWGSRLGLAVFVAVILLGPRAMSGRERFPAARFVTTACAGVLFLFFGYALQYGGRSFLRTGTWQAVSQTAPARFALDELGFPLVSVAASGAAVYGGRADLRYFADVPLGFLHVLPERWVNARALSPPLSELHTRRLDAAIPGGTVPTDLVSLGLYSLGGLGVVVLCFLFGVFCAVVDRYLRRLRPRPVGGVVRLAIALSLATVVVYADPAFVIRNNFYLATGLVLLLFFATARGEGSAPSASATRAAT